MADIAPSSAVTRIGSLLVIAVVALVMIWAAANTNFIGNLVRPRTQ